MNWTYYIITKETSQIVGFADNFVEAYNQAAEKRINSFIVQGSILTEVSAPASAPAQEDEAVEVPEDLYNALEGIEEEEEDQGEDIDEDTDEESE